MNVSQSAQNRKNALEEIEKKKRSKSRFLAAAAHDLRQPMYAAQLFVDSLSSTPVSSLQLNSIKKTQEALKAMSYQLRLLLDMARLEDADVAIENASISTVDFFEQLA